MTLESMQPQPSHWSALTGDQVAARLVVDCGVGLSAADVAERQGVVGLNRLAEPPRRSKLRVFLDQFRTGIVYVLAGAGLIAGVLGDIKDLIIIFVVLFVNAILGYAQEAKASNALAALEKMLITRGGYAETDLPTKLRWTNSFLATLFFLKLAIESQPTVA